MAYVVAKEHEDFDSLYKKFKRKVNDEKIIKLCRLHERFLNPAEKRKLKLKEKLKKANKKKRQMINVDWKRKNFIK